MLNLPVPEGQEQQAGEDKAAASKLLLAELAVGVRELRRRANRVGLVPEGYPLPLAIIMKTIHRLLPWYTRSIQAHAQQAASSMDTILICLQAIVQSQERIAERLDRLERETRRPAEAGSPPQQQ
ncbi:MAG TPA: hypothetical protein VLE22_22335 [Bryobacteraceae bacterium]|nr:hypothetical protein [Bryobacteraceae bacterium]